MSIRPKQKTPYAQGYADYRINALCPFDEGSVDAQEWEIGWMDARRDGVKGDQGIGGELIDVIERKESCHEQRPAVVSRTVRGIGTIGVRTHSTRVA